MSKISRREAMARMATFVAAGGLAHKSAAALTTQTATTATSSPDASMIIAHITDEHIKHQFKAEHWVSKCLHQIQSHADKPQMILNTGDSIYDSVKTDRDTADRYWKVWNNTLQRENSLPIHSILGNHDIWGLRHMAADAPVNDPMFGKKLGQEGLGLDKLYYSFDRGNWHFVMLDSVIPVREEPQFGWIAGLGDEQLHWLEKDLEATPANRPTVVCSHVPIMQVVSMRSAKPDENGQYLFGPRNMLTDARQVIDLFKKHPNVKLCLSGHCHARDRISLEGATYINAGSVCGHQWHVMTQPLARPGYSIIALHPDGTFDYKYENYGWKPA